MFKEMNCTFFKAHKIFVVALLIGLAHFVLISVVSHYIDVRVGTQVGRVVAEGLMRAHEKSPQNFEKSEEEAKRISQDMKNRSEGIVENWKLPLFLISVPIKPLMGPYLKKSRDTRIRMVLSKEMSKDQFYKRGIIIDYTANFVNSFCIGFLIYVILRITRRHKRTT